MRQDKAWKVGTYRFYLFQELQDDLDSFMKGVVVEKELMSSMAYIMDLVGK